jgi:hypothetical protein
MVIDVYPHLVDDPSGERGSALKIQVCPGRAKMRRLWRVKQLSRETKGSSHRAGRNSRESAACIVGRSVPGEAIGVALVAVSAKKINPIVRKGNQSVDIIEVVIIVGSTELKSFLYARRGSSWKAKSQDVFSP